jgi:hypothetical protein
VPTAAPVDQVLDRLFPTQLRSLRQSVQAKAGRTLSDADATKVLRHLVQQMLDANTPGKTVKDFRGEDAGYALAAIDDLVSPIDALTINTIVPPPTAPATHAARQTPLSASHAAKIAPPAKPDKNAEPPMGLDTWIGRGG